MRKRRKHNNRIERLLKIIFIEFLIIVALLLCFVYILPNNPVSRIFLDFVRKDPLVVLDAGHGGYDAGSEFNGVLEKNVTLEITKKIGEELEKRGIPVLYTRDSDNVDWPSNELQDLEERVHIANTSGASLFVSIHTNATETKDGQGFEIWTKTSDEQSKQLAENIEQEVITLPYINNRGIKFEEISPLHVLHYNELPAVLIEAGFLESEKDCQYLLVEEKQIKFAEKIADGIENTLKNMGVLPNEMK